MIHKKYVPLGRPSLISSLFVAIDEIFFHRYLQASDHREIAESKIENQKD